jgi:2-polyprenyl-3-methyl-5-hydroxy-6-metoxy-1,4-benzoquinol methylase
VAAGYAGRAVKITSIERAAPAWVRELEAGPEPVLWNLRGMAQGWRDWPDAMDFLDPASSNHAFKTLESELYLEAAPALRPDRPVRVLDAACGIGRFSVPLAESGCEVVALDACLPSLEAASRHLDEAARRDPGVAERVRLVWDDVDTTEAIEGPFDLVLALELLCYLPDPTATARRLAAQLAPGGHLVVSVEAWPGALLADPAGLTVEGLATALRDRQLAVPDERWVRPIDAAGLAAILRGAGLEVVSLEGTHYLPDGPLMPLLDLDRLPDPGYRKQVVDLERLLRDEPGLAPLPRAWVAVARLEEENAPCA